MSRRCKGLAARSKSKYQEPKKDSVFTGRGCVRKGQAFPVETGMGHKLCFSCTVTLLEEVFCAIFLVSVLASQSTQ